jgi:hypothetical protein
MLEVVQYVLLEHSLDKLFDYMEHYELADALNLPVKQAQEMNDSNENKNKKKEKGQMHCKKLSDDDNACSGNKHFCIFHKVVERRSLD